MTFVYIYIVKKLTKKKLKGRKKIKKRLEDEFLCVLGHDNQANLSLLLSMIKFMK